MDEESKPHKLSLSSSRESTLLVLRLCLILKDYSQTETWQKSESKRQTEQAGERKPIMRANVDSGPTSCGATVNIIKINHLSYHHSTERTRLEATVTSFAIWLEVGVKNSQFV